ncbi:hypothetical protein ACLMJK_005981 [Lecanora helva]
MFKAFNAFSSNSKPAPGTIEPDVPEPTPQQQRHHPCPSARTCWPGLTIAAFSPFNAPTREVLYRRLCMCTILGLDTFNSVLTIVASAFHFSVIPRIVIAVIHFFCSAWLLCCIGRMYGERIVLHRTFVRRDFDIFLGCLVVVELVLVGWFFGGLGRVTVNVWWGLDLFEFIALIAVGWVASWGPMEGQQTGTIMV